MIKLALFLVLVAVGAFGQLNTDHSEHHHGTSVCAYIAGADCSIFADHMLCATDAKTYNNRCEFSKAHCLEHELHFSHNGTCDPAVDKPDPNLHGNDLVYTFFCNNLKHQTCGADLEIVCGTDGKTYDNLCLFEQARCDDINLQVSTYQACPL
ncbi:hypothetical protein SNE40_003920 [Patella caerulea]|uniref:Kazal-like domain-containing protein n=1 Tax=Patella caerulea TaxID=87958 RepID=A0AAN8QFX5_PATCE